MSKYLAIIFLLIISISLQSQTKKRLAFSKKQPPKTEFKNQVSWADSVFNSLSNDDRIAQMFMVAAYSNRSDEHISEISDLIRKYNLGGIIFFQGGPVRQAIMTNYFQSVAKTPLFISIDGEWGLYMRLDSTQWFPRHMMLGAIKDNSLILELGAEFARQMKALGIHINFAPVVDVNNNPLNPVISNRSFGEDINDVSEKGIMYASGMQQNGVMAVAKHFPGHGDTDADSHLTLPVIRQNYKRIDSLELFPFRKLIENGVGGVMVGHLLVPAMDSLPGAASSLSHIIVNNILRKSLNFNGLVFTDALNMKGAADLYGPGELEIRAILAGNDVLLMPADVKKAIDAIKEALFEGRIRQSQIDSSCYRILKAKEWAGLNRYIPTNIAEINQKLNSIHALALQRKIVESSLTLIKNTNNLLPIKGLDTLRIATVFAGTSDPNMFGVTLSLYTPYDGFYLPKNSDTSYVDSLIYSLRHYNLIIISTHGTDSRTNIRFGFDKQTIRFIDSLALCKRIVLNLMASPYSLALFRNIHKIESILLGYHDVATVQELTAQLIFGGIGAKGYLPVSTSGFQLHMSYQTQNCFRLRYALPEEINIKSDDLNQIDTVVNSAIKQKAFPGCQVLAAKNGVVFYNKSFGYFTYDSLRKVTNSDIYDLASITKIAATVPAVMKLYENGNLKLKNKISAYLPELKKTNKKDLVLMDILTHQARLQPYIPFYLRTIEPVNASETLTSTKYSSIHSVKTANSVYFNTNTKYKDGLYRSTPDIEHGIKVADNLFLANRYIDSIYTRINKSELLPLKEYKYSDLGFYYLYRLVERASNTSLNEYVNLNFYRKLGATTLDFLPLNRFEPERIVPTENDMVFRKQLVHGYVHDQGAAMLGGVCGHAGVFSNANDLAKLMQMYLNSGVYGGEQYFEKSTIDLFTSCPFCKTHNRRGIGFDKPDLSIANGPTCQCVSAQSFGHSGFTGTYTWADPQSGILYIFLSNRVYPDVGNNKLVELNVRTAIQEIISNAVNNSGF